MTLDVFRRSYLKQYEQNYDFVGTYVGGSEGHMLSEKKLVSVSLNFKFQNDVDKGLLTFTYFSLPLLAESKKL